MERPATDARVLTVLRIPDDPAGGEALAELVDAVCEEHTRVVPAESYNELASREEQFRAISVLQQKAHWLEQEIAERKRVETQLRTAVESERAAREAAQEALRVRDNFLAIAAHELRTPLTSVYGYARLLQRRLGSSEDIPEWVAESLQVIATQSEKLARLLSQLLDVTRLEGGQLALDPEPTDISGLVEEAVASARLWSEGRMLHLTATSGVRGTVDPLRIEQVLTNLLSNAVKHSPPAARIEVELSASDGGIEMSVRDHGSGIPPEGRDRLFERFYQAHEDRKGIGLGLYISREIVAMHGGDIRAEFPPDGGTRFVVAFPATVEAPVS